MGKYEYIDSLRNDPTETTPVWKMCLWLAVSTSGFYDWLKRPQSATAARREALAARVRHFFTAPTGIDASTPTLRLRAWSVHRSWCARSCGRNTSCPANRARSGSQGTAEGLVDSKTA